MFAFHYQNDLSYFQSPRERLLSENRRERLFSEGRRERMMSESSQSNSECRGGPCKRRHRRYSTESESPEKDILNFADLIKGKAKPSNLASEMMSHCEYNESVLGQVNLLNWSCNSTKIKLGRVIRQSKF